MRLHSTFHSSLLRCVMHVFFLCAQKEMIRIYAAWVVTFMTYVKPIGNGSIMQRPCYSVCSLRSQPAITLVLKPCPYPAPVCLINVIPEPNMERNLFSFTCTSPVAKLDKIILGLEQNPAGFAHNRFKSAMCFIATLHTTILAPFIWGVEFLRTSATLQSKHTKLILSMVLGSGRKTPLAPCAKLFQFGLFDNSRFG